MDLGKYLNLSSPLPRAPARGPTRRCVDLRIAQRADKLAVVNWLHSKQGPQVHCVALAPISAFDRRVMQSSEPSTVPNFSRLDIYVRVAVRCSLRRKWALYPRFGPRQFRGFAGRHLSHRWTAWSLNLAWSARWCQRANLDF